VASLALAHYFELAGDLVPDPDMQIWVYPSTKMAEALTYQDQFGYREVYPEPGKVNVAAKRDLNNFLAQWLKNCLELLVVSCKSFLKLTFHLFNFLPKLGVGSKHFTQSYKLSHNLNACLYSSCAPEHVGKHKYPVLGKHIGSVFSRYRKNKRPFSPSGNVSCD
jgi:Uncharacterized protein conserved in bacteria